MVLELSPFLAYTKKVLGRVPAKLLARLCEYTEKQQQKCFNTMQRKTFLR